MMVSWVLGQRRRREARREGETIVFANAYLLSSILDAEGMQERNLVDEDSLEESGVTQLGSRHIIAASSEKNATAENEDVLIV